MRALLLLLLGAACVLAVAFALRTDRELAPGGTHRLEEPGPAPQGGEDGGGRGVPRAREVVVAGRLEADQSGVESPGALVTPVVQGEPVGRRPRPAPPTRSRSEEEPQAPPDRMDGPVLEAWHRPGQLAFQGTQVPAEDGSWLREGEWRAWHENGQLHELGAYRGGVEDGPWQWWYEDGTPMAEGRFVDGQRVGEWTFWYESGGLQMRGSYRDGLGSGAWTHWFENGLVRAEGSMEAGRLTGRWRVWNEDGSVNREGTGRYENGEKVGD